MADDDETTNVVNIIDAARKKNRKKKGPLGANADGTPAPATKEDGKLEKNTENVRKALAWLKHWYGYNEMSFAAHVSWDSTRPGRERDDEAYVREICSLAVEFNGTSIGAEMLQDAMAAMSYDNKFHPLCDWLNSLKWDGVSRVERIGKEILGADDPAKASMIIEKVMLAVARRARLRDIEGGVKFDTIAILVGEQGIGKSTFWKELLPNKSWFSDSFSPSWDSKKILENTSGCAIIEWSELGNLAKADREHVKATLSQTRDIARKAWGKGTTKQNRQFVIVGSTNAYDFMTDRTGNRRILPLVLSGVDGAMEGKRFVHVDRLAQWREQLWAEIVTLELAGVPLHLSVTEDDAMNTTREDHMETDPWWDIISKTLPAEGMWSSVDAFEELGVQEKDQTPFLEKRLGALARSNGWAKRRVSTKNGVKETFWCKGEKFVSGMYNPASRHIFKENM
jgi:predicted P-loop ATPase